MATFGENLRREREMRGVSLEEICDATKISVRLLRAVEADQFEKLPGGIFTRSFIRAYAKYLGLDEETVMAEFQLVSPASAQPADLGRIGQQRPAQANEGSRAGIIGLVVALLMLSGGFAYYHYARRAPKAAPNEVRQVPKPSSSASASTLQPQPPASAAIPGGAAAATTSSAPQASPKGLQEATPANSPAAAEARATPSPGAANGLVLQVAATEQSWVAVESDGKPVAQRTMQPNEIQTFRANSSFDLITGNAEGVILTLNGKTLDPLGHRGETKKIHLTLEDVQNVTP
jgi:cytoskeleton protein RodZ